MLSGMAEESAQPTRRSRVVVIGGGFGGLQAVKALRRAEVDITLIDRRNFHLFQPLVYQVATGALSPGEVAAPLRWIFRGEEHVRVLLAEVTEFDLGAREVLVQPPFDGVEPERVPYDTLIVAGGSAYSYFGHDEWRAIAPEVKSLESALDVRRRILEAFEAAELERDPGRRAPWLTFAVVGAGPTGVELAGQIGELARDTLPSDFRAIDPRQGRVLLIEQADRVLTAFPESLSHRAERALERIGVIPMLGHVVVGMDEDGVTIEGADGTRRIAARTVLWAAGVQASSLAATLAAQSGAELDRTGRVTVSPDLTLPGHPEVLAIGDMVRVADARGQGVELPGLAPVAMQQGRYAARLVADRLRGRATPPFHYVDKGNLATIGRGKAVADIRGLRLSGLLAWLTWLVVHIFYLVGFQNRLLVMIRWAISFVTRGRGARLITQVGARPR
jgi:NADH:ubiquinone reductase (H+-translocating)